jgi:hypothetical protein
MGGFGSVKGSVGVSCRSCCKLFIKKAMYNLGTTKALFISSSEFDRGKLDQEPDSETIWPFSSTCFNNKVKRFTWYF